MYVRACANMATYHGSHVADFEAGRYVHVPTRAYRWLQTQSPISRAGNSRCRNVDLLHDNLARSDQEILKKKYWKEISTDILWSL